MTNFKTTIKKLPCFVMALVILSTAAIISGCSGTTIDVKATICWMLIFPVVMVMVR